ncbi:PfkB family carbohydrate kinase [Paenibacillus sp. sgz500992]|uniref:PfkB family carbohydrate kinase n=1 Tax=Paenibacillus sp. sgz500992 TaxID=3242476 RepID=UPI0036D35F64
MNLSVYGEIGHDILLDSETIIPRTGGAGLYAALAAARQSVNVNFLTVYGPEINKYSIAVWNKMGVSFDYALEIDNYSLPKYLVTGFKAYEKKKSVAMTDITLGIEYSPSLSSESNGLLMFPIDHSLPVELCIEAYEKGIPVFLDPKTNNKSISSARNLLKYTTILLVNEEEAFQITSTNNLKEAIEALLHCGSKYTILKRGHHGSILISKDGILNFPAYQSKVRCTLGSGDIFAGALAATYLRTQDIDYSIKISTCVAANFIESFETESIINRAGVEQDILIREYRLSTTLKKAIYLAGPFFSEQQLIWLNLVCNSLKNAGFQVLSPSSENGIITKDTTFEERKHIFNQDIKLLEEAEFMVALLDHDDPGTFFEIGYAFKKKIPVFALKTSPFHINNMILFGCISVSSSIEELVDLLYRYGE